ncbi:2-methoxy-6-polyprenyl-1,4-benzoquinol methylase, mitochondrial [Anopheles moucheti]|uniref:2-methoxy-6-polyprenyl-1,4-benzoquinol methylase, mitochondrial n=1 Tax=Anopheles moucheti TaxID=186751 RepID=UPI0022F0A3C3|nr:2-methoxy-6-polyprenyl-1,4-benzoquinol methylase, mitochondrial [Anopheles moucheti]
MSLLRRFALHGRMHRPQLVQFSSSVEKLKIRDNSKHNESDTHFGFQTVKESDKWKKVHKVFEEVAASYDLMNDAMSMGVHRIWKDIFMERLSPVGNGIRLLDMAGGTGDISFRYMKYLQKLPAIDRKPSHVTVCDINQNMLDVGQKRWEKLNLATAGDTIEWVCADAEKLPFDDSSFSVYTIAFGIRNCTHIDRVLAEAYRVLQPGGRFMCLEFSHVNNEYLKWAYDQYSFQVIPPMGQILANQWQPYQYLVESIRKFPIQNEFKTMIENAGFKCVQYENLTFGVVAIHSGFKL